MAAVAMISAPAIRDSAMNAHNCPEMPTSFIRETISDLNFWSTVRVPRIPAMYSP